MKGVMWSRGIIPSQVPCSHYHGSLFISDQAAADGIVLFHFAFNVPELINL